MYTYKIIKNSDDTYNLIISISRDTEEFGKEFLHGEKSSDGYSGILKALSGKYRNLKIKTVVIFFSGVLIASMPFSVFADSQEGISPQSGYSIESPLVISSTSQLSEKFSMTYLYGGSVSQQISKVKQAGTFDTVSPSYFDINSQGKLVVNTVSTELVNEMHAMGIKVVPMLSNHWDRNGGKLALANPEALAAQIAENVKKYNLDGVNVDIENVTQTERDKYTRLVAELRRLIPAEKEVSVAVAANPNGWTTGWHGSYDYEALAKHADYLMIMAYDESWQGSAAGPVASYDFVKKSIEYALKYAPAEKIVVGVPFYGRIWSENGDFNGYGIGLSVISNMLTDYNAKITYDEKARSPKAEFTVKAGDKEYTVGGKKLSPGNYTIWFENQRSISNKINLVHEYNLKGVGSWAINQATDSILQNLSPWLRENDAATKTSTVTADSLRIRTSPNTGGEIIAYYSSGDKVTVVSSLNGWYKIRLSNGETGFVSSQYVKLDSESVPEPEPTPQVRTGYSTGDSVRIRLAASTSATILTTVNKGQSFKVIGESTNGWYNVELSNGTKGYISAQYVSFTPPVTTPQTRTGYSTGDNVRIRSAASTSATILTTVNKGQSFKVIRENTNGWYNVELSNGTKGYISAQYVSFTPPVTTPQTRTGYSTGDNVRIRSAASTSATILTTVNKGQSFKVIGESTNGWYNVELSNSTKGYISAQYVSFTPPVTTPQTRTGYSTGDNVRIRSAASTSATILTTVNKGQSFKVIGESKNGWYNVELSNGTKGYISAQYVSFTAPTVTQIRTGYSTGSNVRVRSAPSTSSVIRTTLSKGQSFKVIGSSTNGWYNVELSNGTKGYVSAQYVSFTAPTVTQVRTSYSTGSGVRVRSSPSTSSTIRTTLSKGQSFKVIGSSTNGWYNVELSSGIKGYVSAQYVRF